MDGLALLENTFKEIGVSFTDKNQLSVAKLLKTMKLNDVINYIKELYSALKQDKSVKDIPALFSSKLEKGERVVKSEPKIKPIGNNIKSVEKEVENKIKKKYSYWLDYYNSFGNLDTALDGFTKDISTYISEYPELCEKYYNKLNIKKGA